MGVVVVSLLAACAPAGGSTAPVVTEMVLIPAMPLPPAASWVLDATAVDELACLECERGGDQGGPDAARFFYGRLPLGTADALAVGRWPDGSPVSTREALGNVVASGYFGGIYLRANLSSIGTDPVPPDAAAESPMTGALDAIGRLSAAGFDGIAADLVRVADTGSDEEVRALSATWATLLAAIWGYNLGYLQVTLENPPPGVTVDPDGLRCGPIFDCTTVALPMASQAGVADVVAQFAAPSSIEWQVGTTWLRAVAEGSVAGGRGVWERLLSDADFAPDGYAAIVDLSGGFLELTQVAMLSNAAASWGGDAARGRVGLRVTAALILWAGSYFGGLASPLPDTAQPTLRCP